ncbi:conserved hypothetical protein [Altererythrobacter sp. B11]|uniref:DUF983 domain-containing protein n=1 Tax=Altererythrobacter sp. B11 TaxID=2060312 RepID=UPI000DC6D3D2|nr:DUF983 domain-containing protein [Altererythrobacter sp. B11]BBC70870.1 conserved hypothetical protein [Altererythrobacter sp. B11]
MPHSTPSPPPAPAPAELPHTLAAAALRGARGHCPRCGGPDLFRKWLKPVDRCRTCGQDWSLQSADDFPPYISIFVTGHLLAPLLILLILDVGLSAWATAAILLPLAAVLMLGILQPAKGAVMALQWWLGVSGFIRERPAAPGRGARP